MWYTEKENKKIKKFFAFFATKRKKICVYECRGAKHAGERGDEMDDAGIVTLYWSRDEAAIAETAKKYEPYCMKIAMNILGDRSDSEECVNDTLLGAWKSIPPHRPTHLAAYLGKITRNLAINRYKARYADKRAAGEFAVSLDELDECIPGGDHMEKQNAEEVGACISEFLRGQKPLERRAFVCRYFYSESIAQIAERFGVSEGQIKSMLFRTRGKLKLFLEQEGINV